MRQYREQEDDVVDGRDEAWYRFLNDIDNLLACGRYTWAEPVLKGIKANVARQGRVTAAQRRALANIEMGLWPVRRRV